MVSMSPRPALGRGLGGVGNTDPPPTGSVPGAESRGGLKAQPAGRGPCLGSRRGQLHPTATAPRPGGCPRAGNTHLRRRHPARPARSSRNSARLLPGPPGLGRGRRPERTNQRRPCALAANGHLPSERSGGIPPPRLGLPPPREQWSNLTRSKWWRDEPLWGCTGGGRVNGAGLALRV